MRLTKVIVKNKMSRFYGSLCVYTHAHAHTQTAFDLTSAELKTGVGVCRYRSNDWNHCRCCGAAAAADYYHCRRGCCSHRYSPKKVSFYCDALTAGRSSQEKGVRSSIKHVICDKTKESCARILTSHKNHSS